MAIIRQVLRRRIAGSRRLEEETFIERLRERLVSLHASRLKHLYCEDRPDAPGEVGANLAGIIQR